MQPRSIQIAWPTYSMMVHYKLLENFFTKDKNKSSNDNIHLIEVPRYSFNAKLSTHLMLCWNTDQGSMLISTEQSNCKLLLSDQN